MANRKSCSVRTVEHSFVQIAVHSISGLLCIFVSKHAEYCRGEPWRTDTSSPWPVIRSTCGCSALYSMKQVRRGEPLCFFKNQANHVINLKSKSNDPHLVTLSLNVPEIICSSGRFFFRFTGNLFYGCRFIVVGLTCSVSNSRHPTPPPPSPYYYIHRVGRVLSVSPVVGIGTPPPL